MHSSSFASPGKGSSALPTPVLSPESSAGPSPALSTILWTPGESELGDYDLNIGVAAQVEKEDAWKMPDCWGHRGASDAFPENTRASFVEACNAGADGIETDIHITSDNVLVMFHDPNLERTTDGKGQIDELPWYGVLEHVRTKKTPHQPIPRFSEVLDLLMEPRNSGVKLNLDCKIENDPVKLFDMVRNTLDTYEEWMTKLAPRIILGIWHPKFLAPAFTILPYLSRYAISMSLPQVRTYFFQHCHGFSVLYEALATSDGAKFRAECAKVGKLICAWTVNGKEEMRQCARWGIESVISDKPAQWMEIKAEIQADRARALKPTIGTYVMPFLQMKNYRFHFERLADSETEYLERKGGMFDDVVISDSTIRIARPGDALA